MNFIPQNETIEIGNTVVTSGFEDGIPRGLVIGTIETFEKEPYQPFQSAVIVPPKDFGRVTTVTILHAERNVMIKKIILTILTLVFDSCF